MSRSIVLPAAITLSDATVVDDAVSGFELRRLVAGELSPQRRAQLQSLLDHSDTLRARHQLIEREMRADDAAVALELPLARFVDEQVARAHPLRAWLMAHTRVASFGALCATAAAVFLLVRTPDNHPASWDGSKGSARVGFFVKSDAGARLGTAGEALHQGDRIQFAVRDDASKHAMVLVGVDGRGDVTLYATEALDGTSAKGDAPMRVLEASVVLDDSAGPERFFVVYADGSLADVQKRVTDAARAISGRDLAHEVQLQLPEGFAQSSVHIVKVR